MACFSIIPMEKQAINFPKLFAMRHQAVKSELTLYFHGMMIQNTENDSKIPKFEALCTETCKLSLDAMINYSHTIMHSQSTKTHPRLHVQHVVVW